MHTIRIEVANGSVIGVTATSDCRVEIVDHDILDTGNCRIDDQEVFLSVYNITGTPLDTLEMID
jgi:hypothetical protein